MSPNFSGTDASKKWTFGHDLGTVDGALGYTKQAAATAVVQAGVKTAVNGGSFKDNLSGALSSQLQNVIQAVAFNAVGDYADAREWGNGSLERTALHAMVGGLVSEAAGGDFASGALAAGANEAMINQLSALAHGDESLLQMVSQLVGVAAAGVTGGDAQLGADIANSSTTYNYLTHQDVDDYVRELKQCEANNNCQEVEDKYKSISDKNSAMLASCQQNGNCEQLKQEIVEGKKRMDSLDGESYAAINKSGLFDQQVDDRIKADQEIVKVGEKSASKASEKSRKEFIEAISSSKENFDATKKAIAYDEYQASLESELIANQQLAEYMLKSDADLDALMPGWRESRDRYASSAKAVADGFSGVAEIIEPSLLDLVGPTAKGARLAGIFIELSKAKKLVPDGVLSIATKLDKLLAGKAPDTAELAQFELRADAKLTAQIKEANKTLASGPKGTASAGGQAASTLPKNFGESVLGHNTQIGVRNSKAGTISGAHNNDAFLESVEITGAKVSNKITDARFPGVVEYSYQLPRTNTKGELIGGYKPVSTKTTYDPKVLPDSKVADMSSRAAVQAESVFKTNPALREASIKVDGYYFQVTRNSKTGEITNSFITMPPRKN